jgi:hypothetical protein
MFEFHQAKRKLGRGGLVVSDGVSWNASLWDFADEFGVPSYNFKGSPGWPFLGVRGGFEESFRRRGSMHSRSPRVCVFHYLRDDRFGPAPGRE